MSMILIIEIVVIIILLVIVYNNLIVKKNHIETFDDFTPDPNETKAPGTTPTPTSTPNTLNSLTMPNNDNDMTGNMGNMRCIAQLQLSSPLQSCGKVSKTINNKLDNYDELVNNLTAVLANLETAIRDTRDKYSANIDQLIATYKRDEDNVRQQKFFIAQNGNVLNINSNYKTTLEKETSNSKETYNINLDLFNKAKLNDTLASDKMVSIKKYTRYILYTLIIILFANTLFLEIRD